MQMWIHLRCAGLKSVATMLTIGFACNKGEEDISMFMDRDEMTCKVVEMVIHLYIWAIGLAQVVDVTFL